MNSKINFNKKGQTVILITILILGVILAITAGLVYLAVKEIRIGKSIKESAQAISAADAGMEYLLFKHGMPDPAYICPNWEEIYTDDKIEYCVKVTNVGIDQAYISIGRAGGVMRAIYSPSPENADQSATITDREQHDDASPAGHDFCRCKGDFGGELNKDGPYAQTFTVGKDGYIYRADIYIRTVGGGLPDVSASNLLKAEILNAYFNPSLFYASSSKPESLIMYDPLASTTDFIISNEDLGDCETGSCKTDISFYFDPPVYVTSTEPYALVVYYPTNPSGFPSEIIWAACCNERRYLPGKGWLWDSVGSQWEEKINGYGFDLEFKTYILGSPGGDFGEVKP